MVAAASVQCRKCPSALRFRRASAPLVTPLALAFRSRWPDVTLDIREGNGADLEEWLLHRHVDLAILQDPPALPDIEITPILTESLGLVAQFPSHLMADTRPASLRELGSESLILPGPQHWIRRRLEIAAQQSSMRLNVVAQVSAAPHWPR